MFPDNLALNEVTQVTNDFNNQLGVTAFLRVVKEGYIVFNYAFQTPDLFPRINTNDVLENRRRAILRECRGLTFDLNGNLIARKFEKFFNMDQMPETHRLDFSRNHLIMDKLDGSMIAPMLVNNKIIWSTKMGDTDIAKLVENFVQDKQNYVSFVLDQIKLNRTVLFEFVSRENKIVVDYPEDNLIMTAIRDNITGNYIARNIQEMWAKEYNIPIVNVYNGKNIHELVTQAKDNFEGYVIWFLDNDQKVKIKLDWYLVRHRAIDALSSEKRVLELVVNDEVDDSIALLDENDQKILIDFQKKFWKNVDDYSKNLETSVKELYENSKKIDNSRRYFAEQVSKENRLTQAAYFGYFENQLFNFQDFVVKTIKKKLNNKNNIEQVREIFKIVWSRNATIDE
jgi:T4 RnlA family RNA ligase